MGDSGVALRIESRADRVSASAMSTPSASASTLRDERARARALLREARNAPALPPARTPVSNSYTLVDLTGWHAVPATQAAQFYTERGKLVKEVATPSPVPSGD